MPKFSVIIITYNREKLLPRALQSLIDQTETDWEAWVVDDGSTDNTKNVVDEWRAKYPKINYVYQKNTGEAGARNKGINLARAEYITFLDSDDAFEPNHLAVRKEILANNPNIDLLHGGVKIIGNQYVSDRHKPTQLIHLSACVIGATFVMKPEKFKALGAYRPMPIGTDADLFERANLAGYKILKTEIPSYIYYRDSDDSMTSAFQKKWKHN
jgi:glycosyltransferase involved in cell wall biosynthesis